jgi:hypothetical protein
MKIFLSLIYKGKSFLKHEWIRYLECKISYMRRRTRKYDVIMKQFTALLALTGKQRFGNEGRRTVPKTAGNVV